MDMYQNTQSMGMSKFICWVESTYQDSKKQGKQITRCQILSWQVAKEIAKEYGILKIYREAETISKQRDDLS